MEKNYLKPEIIEETSLERKLVYAQPSNPRQHCTTLVRNTGKEEENFS